MHLKMQIKYAAPGTDSQLLPIPIISVFGLSLSCYNQSNVLDVGDKHDSFHQYVRYCHKGGT